MFIASKLLSFVTQPLAWVALLLLGALLCLPRRRNWGLSLGWSAWMLLLVQGWEPLPDALLRQLENQSGQAPAPASLRSFVGVIVLGGALEPAYVWQGHGQVALNDAAERMTESVRLMQQPHLKLLFTGGEGELMGQGASEAERASLYFDQMGVPRQRVLYEGVSRNTYENAIFSARLPGVHPEQAWVLLTSAWHMPRALASFRRAGWNVTPYPVDFRAGRQTPWNQYSMTLGAAKWQLVLHEYLGLLAYRLAGRA